MTISETKTNTMIAKMPWPFKGFGDATAVDELDEADAALRRPVLEDGEVEREGISICAGQIASCLVLCKRS